MIQISELTKYYGRFRALDRISLTINKGEILGLLGPNGAGKTTTLRILTGYLTPSSGTITAKGFSVQDDTLEIKRIIGYLPEAAPLYQDMLVYDYLKYVAGIRGIEHPRRESRIREMADVCGLNEVMHRAINQLSRGYKQRVGLAHAMMGDPEILVLDEPTSGLDPNQIVEIRAIIKEIGREKTVILSTHILSEVEATCDRVVIINRGRIVADGSTDELKRSSSGEYTLSLTLKGAPEEAARQALSVLPGVETVERTAVENGTLSLKLFCRTPEDVREEIYRTIKREDWVLLEFTRETRSLESIFRELTKES